MKPNPPASDAISGATRKSIAAYRDGERIAVEADDLGLLLLFIESLRVGDISGFCDAFPETATALDHIWEQLLSPSSQSGTAVVGAVLTTSSLYAHPHPFVLCEHLGALGIGDSDDLAVSITSAIEDAKTRGGDFTSQTENES